MDISAGCGRAGPLTVASGVKNARVGGRSHESGRKQKRASFSRFAAALAAVVFVVPCGLLGGAARIVDEAVDRGFPVNGQARHCAMPDADS